MDSEAIAHVEEQLKDIETRKANHRARVAELAKERQRLAENLKNEAFLKQGRAIEVAKEWEGLSALQFKEKVLLTKSQPIDHLKENLQKLDTAIVAENLLEREAEQERGVLLKRLDQTEREKSAERIFALIDHVVDFQNRAQTFFHELLDCVRSHPASSEDWVKLAETLKRNITYAVTLDSILSPGNLNSLSLQMFIEQLHELTRPGLGSYGDVPNAIKPLFDGVLQTPYPVDRPFIDRQQSTGLSVVHTSEDPARDRLKEIWRRPPSRVVG